jgi:hypothetical protein
MEDNMSLKRLILSKRWGSADYRESLGVVIIAYYGYVIPINLDGGGAEVFEQSQAMKN